MARRAASIFTRSSATEKVGGRASRLVLCLTRAVVYSLRVLASRDLELKAES